MIVEKKYSVEQIQSQFDEVIKYAEGYQEINSTALFNKWEEAKASFVELFGGELIYELPEPVTFELTDDERRSRLNEFISYVDNWNSRLGDFISENIDTFYQNEVKEDYKCKDGTIIPKGMKLLRAFKYFVSDEEDLKNYQSKASMLIQDCKLSGILCFSVHPLDFISSSENTYNWRSCHALDGEYRSGNLSYMCDSSTIICYLRGAEEAFLPGFPTTIKWNSKKWRMLLCFSQNKQIMFASRQYPVFSKNILDIISSVMDGLFHEPSRFGEWHNEQLTELPNTFQSYTGYNKFLYSSYICISHELFKLKDIVLCGDKSLNYNDLLESSCYQPYWSMRYNYYITSDNSDKSKVIVGASVPCLHCGEEPVIATDSYFCKECELKYGHSSSDDFRYCVWCDERLYTPDSTWIELEAGYICSDCYVLDAGRCGTCENVVRNNELNYVESENIYECPCCANARRYRARGIVFRWWEE